MIYQKRIADIFLSHSILFLAFIFLLFIATAQVAGQKLSINNGWRFYKGDPADAKGIFYDVHPKVTDRNDNVVADTRANQTNVITSDWRPDFPMVHILPHWNWPGRIGQVTPVHVFTSGDEAELFLNGRSLGKKRKAAFEYRLRWDDVKYEPGELKVIAYKKGKKWAEQTVKTTDVAFQLMIRADRNVMNADGEDLSFISVKVADKNGLMVPEASNKVSFTIEGPGEIVATDNGDPANLVSFASKEREAFSGLVLAIVRSEKGKPGVIKINASSAGLKTATVEIKSNIVQ
jgi:hypothetical protein